MNIVKKVFEIADIVYHPLQNYKKFDNITKITDVIYDDNEPEWCTADLYFDEDLIKKEKLPIAIYIHGGAFLTSDKYYRRSMSSWYATQGFFLLFNKLWIMSKIFIY